MTDEQRYEEAVMLMARVRETLSDAGEQGITIDVTPEQDEEEK